MWCCALCLNTSLLLEEGGAVTANTQTPLGEQAARGQPSQAGEENAGDPATSHMDILENTSEGPQGTPLGLTPASGSHLDQQSLNSCMLSTPPQMLFV